MVTRYLVCEQCGASTTVEASASAYLADAIAAAGWSTYGAGVTPFAEEWNSGKYQCRRCGDETAEQRVKRLTNEVLQTAAVTEMWAASYRSGGGGHVTIWTDPETTKFDFDMERTDDETRARIREGLQRFYRRPK